MPIAKALELRRLTMMIRTTTTTRDVQATFFAQGRRRLNAAQVPGPRKGIGVSHREVPCRVVRARRHRGGDHSPERHHALLADRLVDHSEGLLPDFTIRHQMSRFSLLLEPLRCLGLRSPLRSTRRGCVLEPYPARTLVLQKRGRVAVQSLLQSACVRVDFKPLENKQCSHGSSPPGKLHAFHGKPNASWRSLSFTSLPVNNDDGKKSYPTGHNPCTPCGRSECRRLRAASDTNEVHGDWTSENSARP